MILPIEPDPQMSELEFRQTLIGLAMISKARGYGIENELLDISAQIEFDCN